MPTFWIVAALLTVAALAFVLVPLFRNRPGDGPSLHEANLAVLRGQRQEIEADVASGVLPADAKDSALAELVARAGEDLAATPEAPARAAPRPWGAIAFFAALVPIGAIGLYATLGNPKAMDPAALAAAAANPASDAQIEAMVEQLAQKVRERPDDVQGWILLARSYNATGKPQKALEAFKHLATIAPDDPAVLADYADSLALSQGGEKNLSGEPQQLVMRALKADLPPPP